MFGQVRLGGSEGLFSRVATRLARVGWDYNSVGSCCPLYRQPVKVKRAYRCVKHSYRWVLYFGAALLLAAEGGNPVMLGMEEEIFSVFAWGVGWQQIR